MTDILIPFQLFLVATLAIVADRLFGEPQIHPLVWFGNFAGSIERKLNNKGSVYRGVLAAIVVLLPPIVFVLTLVTLLSTSLVMSVALDVTVLYFVIGWQSLKEHTEAVSAPLLRGDIVAARKALSMIVSRQTDTMDEQKVVGSTMESLLENGLDSLFASLFWFALFGPVGALLHRLVNTLDAMWGYKSTRFLHFGCFAAKADDWMAWIPARLTAITYVLAGSFNSGISCWREQAPKHISPNGGAVMSAGAGALRCKIGGPQVYQGKLVDKPWLGEGEPAVASDIDRTKSLIEYSLLIWLAAFFIIGLWLFMV